MDFATPILALGALLATLAYSLLAMGIGIWEIWSCRESRSLVWGVTTLLFGLSLLVLSFTLIDYADQWSFVLSICICAVLMGIAIVRIMNSRHRFSKLDPFPYVMLFFFGMFIFPVLQFMFSLRDYEAHW